MSQPLHQIVYLSSATTKLSENELVSLLKGSRKRNEKRGVTGLMLYVDGNIIHMIEGDKETVENLFTKIRSDTRHFGLQLLWSKMIKKRDFPDYRVGFHRSEMNDVETQIPGYSDIVSQRRLPPELLASVSRQVAVFLKTFTRTSGLED